MAADEIWDGWTAALVCHVPQIKRGLTAKEHAEEVRQRTRGGTAISAVAWMGFEPLDKLLDGLCWNAWPHGNAEIELGNLRDRGKIGDRIISELVVDVLKHGHGRDWREEEYAAVGGRF